MVPSVPGFCGIKENYVKRRKVEEKNYKIRPILSKLKNI